MQEQVVAALTHPKDMPPDDRPETVDRVEIHISHFFTGLPVYKMKKEVDFDFLDFTSLGKRKLFRERGLALNKKLSLKVYLRVAQIREPDAVYKKLLSARGWAQGASHVK